LKTIEKKFNTRNWLLILGCLFSFGLIVGNLLQHSPFDLVSQISTTQLESLGQQQDVKPQRTSVRIWKEVQLLSKVFSLPKWGGAYVDEFQNIYLWDYDYKIQKFSAGGKFLRKYGSGRGSGPGEFLTPIDVSVDPHSDLAVCDASTGLVTIFGEDASLKKTIRLKTMPYRIRLVGLNMFLIAKSTPSDHLCELYDFDGNLERVFGVNMFSEQAKYPLLLAAEITADDSSLFCVFNYLSYIVCFNLWDGRTKYCVETIDRLPLPKVETRGTPTNGAIRISKDTPIASYGINLEHGKILVRSGLSARKPEKNPYTVIDVYSSSDGMYLYSYKFPRRGFIRGGFFYETEDTLLTKWNVGFASNDGLKN